MKHMPRRSRSGRGTNSRRSPRRSQKRTRRSQRRTRRSQKRTRRYRGDISEEKSVNVTFVRELQDRRTYGEPRDAETVDPAMYDLVENDPPPLLSEPGEIQEDYRVLSELEFPATDVTYICAPLKRTRVTAAYANIPEGTVVYMDKYLDDVDPTDERIEDEMKKKLKTVTFGWREKSKNLNEFATSIETENAVVFGTKEWLTGILRDTQQSAILGKKFPKFGRKVSFRLIPDGTECRVEFSQHEIERITNNGIVF